MPRLKENNGINPEIDAERKRDAALGQLGRMANAGTHEEIQFYVCMLERKLVNFQLKEGLTGLQDKAVEIAFKQNKELRVIIDDLIQLYSHADFSNGNTCPGGYPDEGEVQSYQFFEDIRERYEELKS